MLFKQYLLRIKAENENKDTTKWMNETTTMLECVLLVLNFIH